MSIYAHLRSNIRSSHLRVVPPHLRSTIKPQVSHLRFHLRTLRCPKPPTHRRSPPPFSRGGEQMGPKTILKFGSVEPAGPSSTTGAYSSEADAPTASAPDGRPTNDPAPRVAPAPPRNHRRRQHRRRSTQSPRHPVPPMRRTNPRRPRRRHLRVARTRPPRTTHRAGRSRRHPHRTHHVPAQRNPSPHRDRPPRGLQQPRHAAQRRMHRRRRTRVRETTRRNTSHHGHTSKRADRRDLPILKGDHQMGDIGEPLRRIELEPLPEETPAEAPVAPAEPEKVPA